MNARKRWTYSDYIITLGLALAAAAGCSASGGTASTDSSGGGGTSSNGSGPGSGPGSGSGVTSGGGGTGACPSVSSTDVATKITMQVTWPGTVGVEAGSGTVHIWTLSTQTYNGNNVTGMVHPCGSSIPDLMGTPIVGGKQIGNTIPDAAWESPSMPVGMVTGTQSGFEVGSTVNIDKSVTLVGATMVNPLTDPWPPSYTGIMTADHDGDTKPGITATAKTGGNFQEPPTSLLMLTRADKLYLATRSIVTLSGTRDTCGSVNGTAIIEKFDNHVVGCHVLNGGECMPAEVDFIDVNRTIFTIGSATYRGVNLPAGSTCTDARAALP
jgi:hypothetical protein